MQFDCTGQSALYIEVKAMKTLVIIVLFTATLHAQQITIRAGTLLDGRGSLVRDTTLVIESSRIVRIDPSIKNAATISPA
jgi:hypothetical protein